MPRGGCVAFRVVLPRVLLNLRSSPATVKLVGLHRWSVLGGAVEIVEVNLRFISRCFICVWVCL